MLSSDINHIDSEYNGYNKVSASRNNAAELNNLPLTDSQKQQQQTSSQNHATKYSTNSKKSVMLNLKSGAINSVTLDEFGNYSTRFSDTHKRQRKWLIIAGIVFGCFCFFVCGLTISYLLDTRTCDRKYF